MIKIYKTQVLPELEPFDRVWVKAPIDPGAERMVVSACTTPGSYSIKIGNREIRRDQKHFKLLQPDSILITSKEG